MSQTIPLRLTLFRISYVLTCTMYMRVRLCVCVTLNTPRENPTHLWGMLADARLQSAEVHLPQGLLLLLRGRALDIRQLGEHQTLLHPHVAAHHVVAELDLDGVLVGHLERAREVEVDTGEVNIAHDTQEGNVRESAALGTLRTLAFSAKYNPVPVLYAHQPSTTQTCIVEPKCAELKPIARRPTQCAELEPKRARKEPASMRSASPGLARGETYRTTAHVASCDTNIPCSRSRERELARSCRDRHPYTLALLKIRH